MLHLTVQEIHLLKSAKNYLLYFKGINPMQEYKKYLVAFKNRSGVGCGQKV